MRESPNWECTSVDKWLRTHTLDPLVARWGTISSELLEHPEVVMFITNMADENENIRTLLSGVANWTVRCNRCKCPCMPYNGIDPKDKS